MDKTFDLSVVIRDGTLLAQKLRTLENTFILYNALIHQGLVLAGMPVVALYPFYRQSLHGGTFTR